MNKHESYNPITARSPEEADYLRETLPEGVPIKLEPVDEYLNHEINLLSQEAHEDGFILGPNKFDEKRLPEPMLNPDEFQGQINLLPTLELSTMDTEPKDDLEATARRMRDVGPHPDRPI